MATGRYQELSSLCPTVVFCYVASVQIFLKYYLKLIQFQFASCMSEEKKKKLPSFPALPYYWFSGEISTRSSWSSSLWKGSPCEAGGKRRFFCSSSVKTHSSLTIAHTILNYYVDPSLNQLLAFFFPKKNNQGRINKG